MRYLIDTNVFVFIATDTDSLSRDVIALIQEPDALLYISAESVRELILAFNSKGLGSKVWKTAEEMVEDIEAKFSIVILPLKKEHMRTYARLRLNKQQGHKDPSDHIIIAHAITEHLPLISSDSRFPYYRRQGLDLIFNRR